MPKKNNPKNIHAQRLKMIRPFVDFDFDLRGELTTYQKRKIKIYFDEINALTARPYQVYKPRSKQRLRQAQNFAQHEKRLAGLKVAFIPNAGNERLKISFDKNGDMVARGSHVTTKTLALDEAKLLLDPESHVNDVIKREPNADRFTALCGRYEIPVSQSRATIGEFIARLSGRYADADANNYFGNWLHGLAAHSFTDQADFSDYMQTKQTNKAKLQKDRRNAKARKRRAKNK